MSGWVSRSLAAIGAGRHKAEADVSYDPVLDDNVDGGTPGPGGSDLDRPTEESRRLAEGDTHAEDHLERPAPP